jgi:hypothetical protein
MHDGGYDCIMTTERNDLLFDSAMIIRHLMQRDAAAARALADYDDAMTDDQYDDARMALRESLATLIDSPALCARAFMILISADDN